MKRLRALSVIFGMILITFPVLFSGCLWFGAKKIPPAFITGGDTVEGLVNGNFETIWETARGVVKRKGSITYESMVIGKMEALVGVSRVIVWLDQVTIRSGNLRIQARKRLTSVADIGTARDIYEEVVGIVRR